MTLSSLLLPTAIGLLVTVIGSQQGDDPADPATATTLRLPAPRLDGACSVEEALAARRSVRSFTNEPISLEALAQLVWAAQGISLTMDAPKGWPWGTWHGGKRTAPSAGALYPLELSIVVGNVGGVNPGVYRYMPQAHTLVRVTEGDRRSALVRAAGGQQWMADAACIVVVGAVYSRTEAKYGERAPRYVHIEVGHAVENLCLQAVALKLGTTVVGAFNDDEVKSVVGMPADEQPLALVPIGKAKR